MNSVQIGRPFVAKKLGAVAPLENAEKFVQLLSQFFDFSVPSLTSAKSLALELAKRTRFLRDQVIREEMKPDAETKDLIGFYDAFKKYLIASLSEEDFADLYAQTITYGLFIARHRFDTTPTLLDKKKVTRVFTRELAYDLIPPTLGILQDVFHFLSSAKPPKQLRVIIEDIAEVLASADLKRIEDEFFHAKRGRDPIVHFYETFLAHYDPAKRESRGVYYTPEPVVSYIVRSLHHLLKEEFGKSDGFATTSVTVLDPAAGTQTFPAAAIHLAAEEYTAKYGKGGLETLIRDHILRNFYAFELMMAPYAIGHLKIAYVLEELGYRMGEDERFKLYLTNTLEWDDLTQTQIPHLSSLSEESKKASEVKKDVPIMVIMGNPPYSGVSENKGKWITELINDYKKIDGKSLDERNSKWLSDDYVKFIRFAQWKIEKVGHGVIGMITNHRYLDNPTFRGMRQSLMSTFTDIYVLDLHGNSKSEGDKKHVADKNVFDIQQGVAIAFFLKNPDKKSIAKVFHAEMWGEREEKYKRLEKESVESTKWTELKPNSPFYFFKPKNEKGREEYEKYWKISDIFPVNSLGITTARDAFTVKFSQEEVWRTITTFLATDPELARIAFDLGEDARDWKVQFAKDDLQRSGPEKDLIKPILYRPFDNRFTYYTGHSRGYHCMPRSEVMQHMIAGPNLGISTTRSVEISRGWEHALCASEMITHHTVSLKEVNYFFPLYCYPPKDSQPSSLFDESIAEKSPNMREEVLIELKQKLKKEPKPEGFLAYVYAILYSPEYRTRYAEFLKSDFPRIPITSNAKLFDCLAKLGQELVDLHLLTSKKLEKPIAKFEGSGEARMEVRKYDEKKKTVRINDRQAFVGIAPAVWNYHIGGYQVLDKWLKDRKGRILSSEDIRHYCRVATALSETLILQEKIDTVIEEHGGWPIT